MTDAATQAEVDWAHQYDGYRRLAASPGELGDLLEPARRAYRARVQVPDWCGVDLLRGWAFFLARADRFAGGGTLREEWVAVLDALRAHPAANGAERPPPRSGRDITLPTVFSAEPKRHKESDFLATKQARLWEDHVAPINQLVDRIRDQIAQRWAEEHTSQAPPVFVPYIDPDSGGVRARILFLLESPAGPAALGSGMLSADNNDETAKNIWRAYEATGTPRTFGLHWNAVPWYVGDGTRNRSVTAQDVELGREHLLHLLDLAPQIAVVLALGKPAQASVAGASSVLASRGIKVIPAPHPSPISAGVTRGKSLEQFHEALRRACALVAD